MTVQGFIDNKLVYAKQLGFKTYLVVKNEREFYLGTYTPNDNKAFLANPTEENGKINFPTFTGKLLLTNLDTGKSIFVNYENGSVSKEYIKTITILPQETLVRVYS